MFELLLIVMLLVMGMYVWERTTAGKSRKSKVIDFMALWIWLVLIYDFFEHGRHRLIRIIRSVNIRVFCVLIFV